MLKFVVVVVIAFAHGEKGEEETVACTAPGGIRLSSDRVTRAVDQKCAVLLYNDSRNPRDQESSESSLPSIPQKAEDGRDAEADQDGDPLDVSILPANELVFLQVGYVVVRLIGLQLEKQPSDMRVKKPFRNTVRIIVMIHMLMMTPMFARPH